MLPPAIALFSALLKNEGHEVDLFDTTYYRVEDSLFQHDKSKEEALHVVPTNMVDKGIFEKKTSPFVDLTIKLESFQPDLIAMSTVEDTFLRGIRLLEHISPFNIPTIVGGVFPTFAPEKAISYPCVDMVCVGEGENVLIELCRRMKAGKSYYDIPGLWVKTKNGIKTPPIEIFNNIDNLPLLDFSIFEEARLYRPMSGSIYRMLPVETHRGCPYRCAYCNSPSQNDFYRKEVRSSYFRKKSINKIFEDLCYYRDVWKAEYLYFWADTLLAWTNKEFDEFVEMYANIKIPFHCQTRPETITPYRMKRLKEIGIDSLSIGCEHGNEEFRRKVIMRSVTNKEIISSFDCAYDHQVSTTVNNMVGFPDETRALAFDSIELNRKLRVNKMGCVIFTPFCGTNLRKLAVERGYIDDALLSNGVMEDSLLNMPQFSRKQINAIMQTFLLYSRLDKARWSDIEKVEKNFGSSKVEKLHEELKQEYRDLYFA
jgi:radical SAM superfamily enzyme YgiQ (UPF0313 family)